MKVAVIPARGGSKRIPQKNIKDFAGKPIIAYSIEAAIATGIFDRIIVSTDSEKIAQVAREYGAEVPFVRPQELSDDYTPTAPVLLHALQWMVSQGEDIKALCCIYATAPFIRSTDVIDAYDKLVENNVGTVFPVTTFSFSIFRSHKINDHGQLEMFFPEHELTRSQDLPEAFHDAGVFYWLDAKKFSETHKLYAKDAMPVIMPRLLVQDIDTPEDWLTAESLFEICKQRGLL